MDAAGGATRAPPVAVLADAMGVPPPPPTAAEAAEWLNTTVAALWPFMAAYGARVISSAGQAALGAALPPWLGTLTIAEVSLGGVPPRVGGVVVVPDAPAAAPPPPTPPPAKAHGGISGDADADADDDADGGGGDLGATTDDGVDGAADGGAAATAVARSVTVEADIVYAGDAVVGIDLDTPLTGSFRLGVRHLALSGRLLLTARPLLPVLPLAGACSAAFVAPPTVGFDLTGWADVDRLPWVRAALTAAVANVLGGLAVLPARVGARLDPSVDFFAVRRPTTRGGAGQARATRLGWVWEATCPCLRGGGAPSASACRQTRPRAPVRSCNRPFGQCDVTFSLLV